MKSCQRIMPNTNDFVSLEHIITLEQVQSAKYLGITTIDLPLTGVNIHLKQQKLCDIFRYNLSLAKEP